MDGAVQVSKDHQAIWQGMRSQEFTALAERCGTPFYLYDMNDIYRRVAHVRATFDGLAQVYFAVKANPNLELLRSIRMWVDGLDVSSGGEVEQAILAKFEPSQLSFAGPAKTTAELHESVRLGVGCISVESMRELHECARIARTIGVRANVALRINPLQANRDFGIKMGGRAVQFGIDEECLAEAEGFVSAHSSDLTFRGIHVYSGSQCFEPGGIIDGVRNTLRIAREIEVRSGLACTKINFGGGFGVAHSEADRELDVSALGPALIPMFRDFLSVSHVRTELIFELGRYLAASAGIYVTRVVSAKASRGKLFFSCDGGLNHQLAAAGTFGAALRSNFPLRNLSNPSAGVVACNLCGPSCNPTDLLGVDIALPQPSEGDLIGVMKSGSYGLTASPVLFLGHQTPAEFIRQDGIIYLGRKPRSMLDFN